MTKLTDEDVRRVLKKIRKSNKKEDEPVLPKTIDNGCIEVDESVTTAELDKIRRAD